MVVKVKGVREAQANLDRLIGDIRGRKVVRAIQSVLLIGGSQAALYTAIDTSTLLNSQYREISVNGTRVTGRVGYSANYAVYVHDPNIQQTFRRATAKKEFLTKGFEDTKAQRDRAFRREMQL